MTTDGSEANSINLAAISERLQSINRVVRNTAAQTKSPASVDSNTVATSAAASEEPKAAASEVSEAQPLDELSLDDENDGEDRNKRYFFRHASAFSHHKHFLDNKKLNFPFFPNFLVFSCLKTGFWVSDLAVVVPDRVVLETSYSILFV